MQDNPDGIGEADLRAAISDFLSNGEHKLQRISRTCIRKMLHKDNKCSILESEKVRTFIVLFGAILMKESFSRYVKI